MADINIQGLVCPVTKQPITVVSDEAVCTSDKSVAYPLRIGLPVLLGPEADTNRPWVRDIKAPQYAEAYAEMEFYNSVGRKRAEQIRADGSAKAVDSISMKHLFKIAGLDAEQRHKFPEPAILWACDNIDAASEIDCYRHIGSVLGKRVVQVGGSGTVALLLLLAGAAEAMLITPMIGEALVASEIARLLNVSLRCIIGIGEELPLADQYADVCFVGGCVHHMRTDIAMPEIARILKPGGKFAAIEPWKAPGYTIGTAIFGKREANPFCSPITEQRVKPFFASFKSADCIHHGSFTRYPSIVAQKAGLMLSVPKAEWVTRIDDAICDCIPFARKMGSAIALLATK
ncbi:methyltransferase domain-containing protein [Bradyrhizobium sp. F1.4.3]|uniref:methyltransferase domain-containing protein n=1 Tax=Bradyrhizobium sp. F1.4.3 TaxID=3156356 RepID=UPI0033953549